MIEHVPVQCRFPILDICTLYVPLLLKLANSKLRSNSPIFSLRASITKFLCTHKEHWSSGPRLDSNTLFGPVNSKIY